MCCDTLTNYSVFNRIDILEILSYLYRLLYRLLDSFVDTDRFLVIF